MTRGDDFARNATLYFEAVLDQLRAAGLLHDSKVSVKQKQGQVIVALAGICKHRHVSMDRVLGMSFSTIAGRNELAKSFHVSKETVSRSRSLTAALLAECDARLLHGFRLAFLQEAPAFFVSSSMCDATKEVLHLPIHEGVLPQVTKSAWNIFPHRRGSRGGWAVMTNV